MTELLVEGWPDFGIVCISQDYIDSMEGATLSGRQAAAKILESGADLATLREQLQQSLASSPAKDLATV